MEEYQFASYKTFASSDYENDPKTRHKVGQFCLFVNRVVLVLWI